MADSDTQALIAKAVEEVGRAVLGKQHQVRLAVTCLVAGGHLLIEDLPGLGKTTLAHSLAKVFGLQFQRVQFTSDMLPADLLGVSIFNPQEGGFQFHPGPVFSELLLADEINRSPPKTQSSLLEAMEERQVSIEGRTLELPEPFFVIATQNPHSQLGTFPLPESQIDRFLMRLTLGYPEAEVERDLYRGDGGASVVSTLTQVMTPELFVQLKAIASGVTISERLLDYLQSLVAWTRNNPELAFGISPRGALALLAAARVWAVSTGRTYVTPEDLQLLVYPVWAHRLRSRQEYSELGGDIWIDQMLAEVDPLG